MYFDEEALKWDTKYRIDRAIILSDEIKKRLCDLQDAVALEIGCGTGLITYNLCDFFSQIYATDASKEMINILKEKSCKYNKKNVFEMNINSLDNSANYEKFDVIYSSMVFHHIEDIEDELVLLKKLLKKNGRFIVIDLDKEDGRFHKNQKGFTGHNGFERDELKQLIQKGGFSEVNFETIYKGKKEVDDESIDYSLFLCSAI